MGETADVEGWRPGEQQWVDRRELWTAGTEDGRAEVELSWAG